MSSGSVGLKLNGVLTEEFAKQGGYDELLSYALDVGADAVKIVELLETKDSASWPQKAIPAEVMNRLLAARGFAKIHETLRTTYWKTPEGLVVEVTRCACAAGCRHCAATRADFFTGGTHYHPCFLNPKAISLENRPLEDALAEGCAYLSSLHSSRKAG